MIHALRYIVLLLGALFVLGSPAALGQSAEQPATESKSLGIPNSALPIGTQPETSPAALGAGVTRTIFALAAVVGLMVVIAAVVRHIARTKGGLTSELGAGGRAPSGVLSVLGRYPIARGQTLVLLQLGQRVLLLNQASVNRRAGGPAFTTLSELTDEQEVAELLARVREGSGDQTNARFQDALARLESEPEQGPEVVDLTAQPAPWVAATIRGLTGMLAGVGKRP